MQLTGGGFLVACLQVSVVYYSAAVLLHYVVPKLLPVKSIQCAPSRPGQVTREVLQSLGPIAVKSLILVVVERLHAAGLAQLYDGSIRSWPQVLYMLVCVAVLDYLHDSWFYWTHRMLHWKPLFKHVHYMHHKSQVPTAFTGYSFHVIEAAIVFANEIIVCFLFPLHVKLHRIYHLFTTVIHNGGHAGYEISPFIPSLEQMVSVLMCGMKPNPALNTVQHHDMHHRFPNRHFSLYFTHWDRWMGTLHDSYDSYVEQQHTNTKQESNAVDMTCAHDTANGHVPQAQQ